MARACHAPRTFPSPLCGARFATPVVRATGHIVQGLGDGKWELGVLDVEVRLELTGRTRTQQGSGDTRGISYPQQRHLRRGRGGGDQGRRRARSDPGRARLEVRLDEPAEMV